MLRQCAVFESRANRNGREPCIHTLDLLMHAMFQQALLPGIWRFQSHRRNANRRLQVQHLMQQSPFVIYSDEFKPNNNSVARFRKVCIVL